jgi:hypothetical protein
MMGCDNTGIGLPATITCVSPDKWHAGKTYTVLLAGVIPGNASPTVLPGCDYTEVFVYDDSGYLWMSIDGTYIGTNRTSFTITVPANIPSETAYVTLTCDGGCSTAQAPVQIVGCLTPTITSISPSTWFAGKTYDNVAIVGTNFITKDKANAGCAETAVNITAADGSVVPIANISVESDKKITLTGVAPPASDPTETATVTVGTAPNTANSANLATQPQILGNQIQCNPSMNCTQPVISTDDGTDPPLQNVVVGQQVALTTPDLPSGMTATKMTWTADGTRIAGYAPTTASASVQELKDNDLKKANVTFYWVYPENPIEVAYEYCVDIPGVGNQCSEEAKAEFEVDGPTGGSMSFTPFAPAVTISNLTACTDSHGYTWPGGPWMYYATGVTGLACPGEANYPAYGINFDAPTGYSNDSGGSYLLVQLISSDTTTGESVGTSVAGLDTDYPYGEPPSADSPKVYLQSTATSVTR